MLKALREFIVRLLLKDSPKGVMTTLPNKDLVDLNVQKTAEFLMRNGVDPNSLKNANQVENAIKMIENKPKVQEGITSTKSAKVFDLEGKEIDPKKGIMGGKQIPDDDLPPPGSRGGPDDISAPFQSAEESLRDMTEAEIKKKLEKQNKDAVKRLKDKMKDDPEDMAQGGRAGFKLGSIDKARRAFLKTIGAAGAGITALKTGILGLGKEAAPAVEAVKETVTQAPSYFFDLVAKIKLLGEPRRTPSYKERVNEYQYTGKDGIEYELTEDLDTGEITIQKDKIGGRSFEEGSYEVIEDRTEMRYKKPKPDEGDPNPAEEYEEYKVEFDQDGTAADASEIDEISKKEIIREVTEDAPSIKKAGGGIARMLGE